MAVTLLISFEGLLQLLLMALTIILSRLPSLLPGTQPTALVAPFRSSRSPLLSLPVELYAYIVDFLHGDHVASRRERTPHPLLALRM